MTARTREIACSICGKKLFVSGSLGPVICAQCGPAPPTPAPTRSWTTGGPIANWKLLLGIILALAIVFGLAAAWTLIEPDDRYTKEDCIRQWHELGVYADAPLYCADYP